MSYETKYHDDGTIEVWDVHRQSWVRNILPSQLADRIWASVSEGERQLWERHEARANFRAISQHRTPGPWAVSVEEGYDSRLVESACMGPHLYIKSEDGGNYVALLLPLHQGEAQQRVDAAVMAAAPRMLEALRKIASFRHDPNDRQAEIWAIAEAFAGQEEGS
jgi:hypothetical protein